MRNVFNKDFLCALDVRKPLFTVVYGWGGMISMVFLFVDDFLIRFVGIGVVSCVVIIILPVALTLFYKGCRNFRVMAEYG